LRNLIFSLIVTAICIGLAEVVLRVALPVPGFVAMSDRMLQQHPTRSYTNLAGFSGVVSEPPHYSRVEVTINELGMRDDPVVAGETIDYLAVGDSFTAGAMVAADEAWPERLESYLNEAGDKPVRVLNGGVSGYNMQQIRLAAEEYSGLKPGAVIVGAYPSVVIRMHDPFLWFDGFAIRESRIPMIKSVEGGVIYAVPTPWLSKETQFWLIENFRFGAWIWKAIEPFAPKIKPPPPARGSLIKAFIDELAQLKVFLQAQDIPMIVFLITSQEEDGSFAEFAKTQNQKVKDWCVANNVLVFDTYDLMATYPADGLELRAADGADFHWSPLGHDLAAKALADYISSATDASQP